MLTHPRSHTAETSLRLEIVTVPGRRRSAQLKTQKRAVEQHKLPSAEYVLYLSEHDKNKTKINVLQDADLQSVILSEMKSKAFFMH